MFNPISQINENEMIDDPKIPLELRKEILLSLDECNKLFCTYSFILYFFEKFLKQQFKPNSKIKILEIGSGSGGLAREILKKFNNAYNIEYTLFDLDIDVLNWAKNKCAIENLNVDIHQATEEYLKVFDNNYFDIIISLHTIHHIHPKENVLDFFKEISRCSKHGYFMIDFHRKIGNVSILKLLGTIFKLPKHLVEDGVKSLNRSYTIDELKSLYFNNYFHHKINKFWWNPYLIISAIKSSEQIKG